MGILKSILSPRGLLGRATPENPSFNLYDEAAWDAFTDGKPATSGVRVNPETALTYSPWWKGVSLISSMVAKLPLFVYRREGQGKVRDPAQQAYGILRYKPNPYQTALTFKRQLTGHAITRGNGYAYIERDNLTARPINLWPLDPCRTYPVKDRESGRVWIVIEGDKGPQVKLDPSEVLHVKGLSNDGLVAYSVVDKAREALGEGMAGQRASSIYFKNGARPSVVLEAPNTVTEPQMKVLRSSWGSMQEGLDNYGRTAILDRGLKAHTLSFSPEDSQLVERREFNVRDIANFLGLPPHKLGDNSRTAYASLEQENQSCLDEAYDPWLCAWEEECRDKLLTEAEKAADSHVVEFLRSALLKADITARGNFYRVALAGAPFMARNEVRGLENMNPLAGGDELIDPKNMGDAGGADNQPNDPAATNVKPSRALVAAVQDAARRAVRRLAVHAEKAARQPRTFLEWIEALPQTQGPAVRDILTPAYELLAEHGGTPAEERVVEFLRRAQAALLDAAGRATPKQLPEAVTELARAQEQEVASWNADTFN